MPELQITEADRKQLVKDAERIVRSHEDAEDVVQAALLRAWAHRGEFRGEASSYTYLRACVRNGCIMFLRYRSYRPALELDAMVDQEVIGATIPHIDEEIDARRQLAHAVRSFKKHKATWSARKHMAVVRLYANGLTHEEIARELHTTPGASKSAVHRFRLVLLRIGGRAA